MKTKTVIKTKKSKRMMKTKKMKSVAELMKRKTVVNMMKRKTALNMNAMEIVMQARKNVENKEIVVTIWTVINEYED